MICQGFAAFFEGMLKNLVWGVGLATLGVAGPMGAIGHLNSLVLLIGLWGLARIELEECIHHLLVMIQ